MQENRTADTRDEDGENQGGADSPTPRDSARPTGSATGVSGAVIPHADPGPASPVKPRDARREPGALSEEEQQDPNVRSGTGI
jgi:hypothetical protein